MKRIYAIVSALAVICITQVACTSSVQTADEEEDVKAALTTFVRAFENGDLDVMEASFAENSSTFPRAIMSNDVTSPIRASEYRRVKGLDPQMRQLIAGWREGPVALVTEQGYKISEAARSLDVGANLIGGWRRQFEDEASGMRLSGEEREELKRLRKEVRQLRMEKEILKKASQYFAKEMK